EQLAVLSPKQLEEHRSWLGESARTWLARRALELSYTGIELLSLAQELDYPHPPFKWEPDRRASLQAEIDAAIFHLYGLRKPQVEWIIDSFGVLKKYEEQELREFRTRRLVLEYFDLMGRAEQTGG